MKKKYFIVYQYQVGNIYISSEVFDLLHKYSYAIRINYPEASHQNYSSERPHD